MAEDSQLAGLTEKAAIKQAKTPAMPNSKILPVEKRHSAQGIRRTMKVWFRF